MSKNWVKITFLLIILLFLFTRLYKISEIPVSVYWDEASIGYNAYSISQTGKDEWGDFLPIHFRAFGEFKLPVYIYSVVPFVKLFGLNEFSIRFPAVLFSLGVVILTYLLTKRLWGSEKIGLFAAFFITISPWFFIFSRTGYEAVAGLMFYLLGVYLFLKIQENRWVIILSVACFILSAYSYNSFRIVAPLTILSLLVLEFNNLKSHINNFIIPLILSAALLLLSTVPILRLYILDAGVSRLQAVGALSTSDFFQNYLTHFSWDFLLNGDKNLRSQQAGFGQLYFPEIILLPLGFLYMVKSKSQIRLLPLVLLLLGPIPAAATKESPHALRAISMVPFISIISATGVAAILPLSRMKSLINVAVSIIFLAFFTSYFWNFQNTYPKDSANEWQYEYKNIYTDYGREFDKYRRIIISDEYAQPYIFALFYLKYDPQKFRQEVIRNDVSEWGFSTVKKFGKFEFRKSAQLLILER